MIDTINISVEKTTNSKLSQFDQENLVFGKLYSDHMFIADYENGEWGDFRIVPYGDLSISPANTTLHYSQTVFEGLKAYRTKDGEIAVFRPIDNAKRLNKSAERVCIPELPEEIFMEGLHELLKLDHEWVPSKEGTSLYIRPFIFGFDPYVGIRPSDTYKFIIITCPVGAYYAEPVKVKVETHYTRAAAGGTGFAKTGGNYAAALYPAVQAQKEGYNQLIWTDGKNHEYIEEAGTMNLMFVIDNKLVTAPTGDTILKGITRDSVMTLAKEWGIEVEERPIKVTEVIDAIKEGRMQEAFGAGTAATIAQIKAIGYDGVDYELPAVEGREISNRMLADLNKIKSGELEDKHGWLYKI
jgi:branched-chain amino acid aminotransferase